MNKQSERKLQKNYREKVCVKLEINVPVIIEEMQMATHLTCL
jgi:hypothetical protein